MWQQIERVEVHGCQKAHQNGPHEASHAGDKICLASDELRDVQLLTRGAVFRRHVAIGMLGARHGAGEHWLLWQHAAASHGAILTDDVLGNQWVH